MPSATLGTTSASACAVSVEELPVQLFTPPPPPFSPGEASVMPACEGFELIRVLGAGAMGVVFEARSRTGGGNVALKVLREEYAVDPECVLRFEREVRIATRIQSRHVPKVLGLTKTQDGLPCMVMERLVGKSLSKVLEERGPLPVVETIGCMMQICAALESAHAVGVVHRDLKPSNVFFAEEAGSIVVKVMDFGLSKLDGDVELTGVHATFGTPRFMSPEQIRSPKLADRRSDLWALGVMLYLMLSGRYPFAEQGYAAVLVAIANTEPIHLADVKPGLDRLLASVVMNLLKKDPALRYQDVQELVAALRRFLEESGTIDAFDADESAPFLPSSPLVHAWGPQAASEPPPAPRRYAMIPTPTNASRMNWSVLATEVAPSQRAPSFEPPFDPDLVASMRPPRFRVPLVLLGIVLAVLGFVVGATRTSARPAEAARRPPPVVEVALVPAPVTASATSPSPTSASAPAPKNVAKERAFFQRKLVPR